LSSTGWSPGRTDTSGFASRQQSQAKAARNNGSIAEPPIIGTLIGGILIAGILIAPPTAIF
jgi:hypothetical protein